MAAPSAPITVLALTIEHQGESRDMIVELPNGASVSALMRALRQAMPELPDALELSVARTGELLPRDAVLTDRDVRFGDTLRAAASLGIGTRTTEPEPLVGLRRRNREGDPEVVLGGPVRLRSSQLRRASPPLLREAESHGQRALLQLHAQHSRLDVPAGDHAVALDASGEPFLTAPDADATLALRVADDGSADVLALGDPAADLIGINGAVAPSDWVSIDGDTQLRVGATLLQVRVLDAPQRDTASDRLVVGETVDARTRVELGSGGTLDVHRPPRRISPWRPVEVELPATPMPGRKIRLPLVAALVPLVAGVVMFAITKSPLMLMFCALSPMMAFGSYFSDRRQGKESARETAARFEQRIDSAYRALVQTLNTEAEERRAAAPTVDELRTWPRRPSARLWERRPWDADFLTLRVGLGDLPALGTVKTGHTSSEVDPDPRLQKLAEATRVLADIPATVPLGDRPVVGLAGDRTASTSLARSFVVQAAALHSPLELGIVAALPPGGESAWEWLKWLPHTQTAAGVVGRGALATGRDALELLRATRDVVEQQRARQRARTADAPTGMPSLLVLIDEQLQVDRALVTELLGGAAESGLAVIWIGHDPRSLPGQCGTVIDSDGAGQAILVEVAAGTQTGDIQTELVSGGQAERFARELAPARDVTLADRDAAVPARVKLLDQLGLTIPTGAAVAERWQRARKGIGAEIGMAAGVPLTVDLRSDGPHALIAGTTGAGKSELLRTIVASLAATHPPNRLAFLLIDYKGGAAFAPCAGLPHVLDVVSDLDAELGERALVSLGAEMKRRELILAEHKADNLLDLERSRPDVAPPNLLIIVDEFAKLREEIPDFVDGVVDVAQRGRTLGIHMVLAAQSLRNAFTPAVRANTNLRIALRVTSDTESQDVIDAPDAARIPSTPERRGRAYARIGHERLVEFQSAHVSGRFVEPGDQEVVARAFGFSDVPAPSTRKRREEDAPPGSEETDLAALRRAAESATELLRIPAPRPAWTDPLPEELPRTAIQHATSVRDGRLAIGLLDQPAQQAQSPLMFDLDRGHLAIFGMSGAGKTSALLTVATAAVTDAAPSELELHVIDADGGALSLLADLPHVSGVVSAADAERLERLIQRLEREVRQRSGLLSAAGASTLTEYQTTPDPTPLRRILVLLDGFGEFASMHDTARADSLFDRLLAVLSAGRSVGLHAAISADRRGAVRSALMPTFPQRVLLRQTASDDLVAFGVPSKLADQVHLRDGRAFVEGNLLAQLALPTPALDGGLAEGFARLAAHLTIAWPGSRARGIESLPERARASELPPAAGLASVPLGIGGADLAVVTADLTDRHFLVVGGYRTGRSTALARFATAALESPNLAFVHLLAPRRSALTEMEGWSSITRGLETCVERALSLAQEVLELPESTTPRGILIVDDAGELQDPQVAVALERVVRLGRDRGVRVVAAAETSAARMLGNLWLRELRRDQHGLLLAPDLVMDGDILAATLPRRSTVAMAPGRGFLVADAAIQLLQVAE